MPKGDPQYHRHPAGCARRAERKAAAKPLRAYPFTQELVVENLLCSKLNLDKHFCDVVFKKREKPQLSRIRRPEGKPSRKKKDSFFLAGTWLMKSYELFYSGPLNFLLPSIKEFSFSWPAKTWIWLIMAHHGCRCQIVIICWSPIYPSLLEKYLAVYLLLVNILAACTRNREDPQRLQLVS